LKLFVDTWGWLVLADKKDPHHGSAARCYEERSRTTGRVVTSNFVLDEALTLLFRRRPFDEAWRFANALLQSSFIAVETVTEGRFRKAFELRRKLADKPGISFTDLTSMIIMSELRATDILTGDQHFSQVGLGFRLFPD
jgi:uncharacterized protein